MSREKTISMATALSLVGGGLNLLISTIRLHLQNSFWFLTSISGVVIIVAAIFLYLDSRNQMLWGGIIFLYSNISFVAFGLSYERRLLPYGFIAMILGLFGGALGIYCDKINSSRTE